NILSYFQEVYPETAFAAIEPSETCQEILRSKGVQVLTHDVDTDLHLGQEGKYDLIIMRHVLEHFMNPLEVLKKVASVLSENGQLYIAVPNALYLEESAFFTHWLRVVHTYYFNRISLTNLCHLAGLHIQWMQEGDQANRQELFAVVSRAAAPQEVSIDPQNFLLQQAAYDKKMRQEKMPFASLLRKGKRMLRKISS
ncbi:MAG: class I SAM-dependent methyltransferase, partial [Bacteroidota bacterium]